MTLPVVGKCDVCGSTEYIEDTVNEIFEIDGRFVLVENIPARVCVRCGDVTFSRETTEHIRQLVHDSQAQKSLKMDVFTLA